MRVLTSQRPQQPQLVALQAVDARRAVLGAADVDGRGIEINLLPANVDQLADPQRMPKGHEDEQPIADGVAAVAGSDWLGKPRSPKRNSTVVPCVT
jgi:uncharacterized protein YlxW (UPF0749 family)